MRIIHSLDQMTQTARGWLTDGAVGFVPTMGYLHEGHITLVQAARQECAITVASIFVNPMQFDQSEEFTHYPRDPARDLQLLRNANVDIVFIPRTEDMFPPDFSTYITPAGPIAERLESLRSPGYIRGVATAGTKLLQLVRPDKAYFGRKNAHQVVIVRKLVRDLNLDVSLRILPTVRESDGLAMSSRTHTFSPAERQAARIVYSALLAGKTLIEQGERRSQVIEKAMADLVASEPLVRLDYAVVCHPDTFLALDELTPPAMLALAAHLGTIDLIDNIVWAGNGQWIL